MVDKSKLLDGELDTGSSSFDFSEDVSSTDVYEDGSSELSDGEQTSDFSNLFASSGDVVLDDTTPDEGLSIESVTRSENDMIIELADGTKEVIKDYFSDNFDQDEVELAGNKLGIMEFQALLSSHQDDILKVPVGEVTSLLGGEAFAVDTFGFKRPLNVGDDLFFGEELVLDELASLSVSMNDDSVFSLSSGARMVIDSHVFDEGASDSNGSLLSIIKGTLLYISGKVAQQGYDNVGLVTPIGTIGIRGTSLIASVKGKDGMDVTLMSGAIAVRSGDGDMHMLDEVFASLDISDGGVSRGKADPRSVISEYSKLFASLDFSSVEKVLAEMKAQGFDAAQMEVMAEEMIKSSEESQPEDEDSSPSDAGSRADSVLDEGSGQEGEAEEAEGESEAEEEVIEVRQNALINRESSGDFIPPDVPKASLFKDTGSDFGFAPDLITQDPRIQYIVEPLSELVVFDSLGNEVFRGKAGEDGNIVFNPGDLDDGEYSYRARSIDDSKNESELSVPFVFVLDTTSPSVPSGMRLLDGPVNAISAGLTAMKRPSFEVDIDSSEAGGMLYVRRDGKEVGKAKISGDGKTIVTIDSEQPEGSGQYEFYAVDGAGNRSALSRVNIEHDYTAPVEPAYFVLKDNKSPDKSGVDQLTKESSPDFTIKSERGAIIEILDADGNVISDPDNVQIVVEGDGEVKIMSLKDKIELGVNGEDKVVELKVKITDVAGNSEVYDGYDFRIDRKPPEAPSITLLEKDGNVDQTVNSNPEFKFSGLEEGATIDIVLRQGSEIKYEGYDIEVSALVSDLKGISKSGSSIEVTWVKLLKISTLTDGTYELEVTQKDQAGNVGAKATSEFTMDTEPPDIVSDALTFAESDKGTKIYTTLSKPELLIKGEAGSSFSVEVDGKVLLTGIIGVSGEIKEVLSTAVGEDGKHKQVEFKLTLTDPSGNSDNKSFLLDVDRKLPEALDSNLGVYESDSFSSRVDTEGSGDGFVSGGSRADRPLYVKVAGLTDTGGKVVFTLKDSSGSVVKTTVTLATTFDGIYSEDLTISGAEIYAKIEPFSNKGWSHGDYELSYHVNDKHGNSGEESASKTIGIDLHAPASPIISAVGLTVGGSAGKYMDKNKFDIKLQIPVKDDQNNEEDYASIKVYRKLSSESDTSWVEIESYIGLSQFTKNVDNYELTITQDLTDETYVYKVEASDKADHKTESELEVVVDTEVPPEPALALSGGKEFGGTYYISSEKSEVKYTITAGEENPDKIEIKIYDGIGNELVSSSIFEIKDGSIYLTANGKSTGTALGEGTYEVEIKYFDTAGRFSSSKLKVVQDVTDPVSLSVSTDTTKVYSTDSLPTFTITKYESGAKLYYELVDSAVSGVKSGNVDSVSSLRSKIDDMVKGLTKGYEERDVTLTVWQVDKAGNVGAKTAVIFSVDSKASDGIVSQSGSSLTGGALKYAISKTDSDTKHKIYLDVSNVISEDDTLHAYEDGSGLSGVTFHYEDPLGSVTDLDDATDYRSYNGKKVYASVSTSVDLSKLTFAFEDNAGNKGVASATIDGTSPDAADPSKDLFYLSSTTSADRYADMKFNIFSVISDVKYVKLVLEYPSVAGKSTEELYITVSDFKAIKTFKDVISKFSGVSERTGQDEYSYNLRVALVDEYGNESGLSDKGKGNVTIDLEPPTQPSNVDVVYTATSGIIKDSSDVYQVKKGTDFSIQFDTSDDVAKVVFEYSKDGTTYGDTFEITSLVADVTVSGRFKVAITNLIQTKMLSSSGLKEQEFSVRIKSVTDEAGNKWTYSDKGDVIRIKLDDKAPDSPSLKEVSSTSGESYFDDSDDKLYVVKGKKPNAEITIDKSFGEDVEVAFYLGTDISKATASSWIKASSTDVSFLFSGIPATVPAGSKLYIKSKDSVGNESVWKELFKVEGVDKAISSYSKAELGTIVVTETEGDVKDASFSFEFTPSVALGKILDTVEISEKGGAAVSFVKSGGKWTVTDIFARSGVGKEEREYTVTLTDKFAQTYTQTHTVTLSAVALIALDTASLVADTGVKSDDEITSDSRAEVSYTPKSGYTGDLYLKVTVTYDDLTTSAVESTNKEFYIKYATGGKISFDLTGKGAYEVTGGVLSSTASTTSIISGSNLKFATVDLELLNIADTSKVGDAVKTASMSKLLGAYTDVIYDEDAPDSRSSSSISLYDVAVELGSATAPVPVMAAFVKGGSSEAKVDELDHFAGVTKGFSKTVDSAGMDVYTMDQYDAKSVIVRAIAKSEGVAKGSSSITKADLAHMMKNADSTTASFIMKLNIFFPDLDDDGGDYTFSSHGTSTVGFSRTGTVGKVTLSSGDDLFAITGAKIAKNDIEFQLKATDVAGNEKIVKIVFEQWTNSDLSKPTPSADVPAEDSFAYSDDEVADEAADDGAFSLDEDVSPLLDDSSQPDSGLAGFDSLSLDSPLDDDPGDHSGGGVV